MSEPKSNNSPASTPDQLVNSGITAADELSDQQIRRVARHQREGKGIMAALVVGSARLPGANRARSIGTIKRPNCANRERRGSPAMRAPRQPSGAVPASRVQRH